MVWFSAEDTLKTPQSLHNLNMLAAEIFSSELNEREFMESRYLAFIMSGLLCASYFIKNKMLKITFLALTVIIALLAVFGVFDSP